MAEHEGFSPAGRLFRLLQAGMSLDGQKTILAAWGELVGVNPDDKAAGTDVQRIGKALKDNFTDTPYAVSAGLLLARHAADRGDFKEAEKQLRWVLEQKPGEAERLLATTRLARVLVNCGGGSFKSQFKKADKSGARFAIVLGQDEVAAGTASVKWLREEREQVALAQDAVAGFLKQQHTL